MKNEAKIALAGSSKKAPEGVLTSGLDKTAEIELTIRLRRKSELLMAHEERLTHEEYADKHGAKEEDTALVTEFLTEHHLRVTQIDLPRRSMMVQGTIADMEAAFNVKLEGFTDKNGNNYRFRTGDIFIPESLQGIVEGVFGLDNRPAARPMLKIAMNGTQVISHAAAPKAFNPNQLSTIYGYPADVNGAGQTIGIIELGGGYRTADIDTYFTGLKMTAPQISAVEIDNGSNSPSTPDGADGEVMLDIEVAGAVAPGAKIVVYFADNTDKGFLDAITSSIHDTANKPSVISISWGSAETNWTQQATNSMNEAFKTAAALGVTITVAAGDNGSSDGVDDGKVHVDFPASSPYVLACGGTRLEIDANGTITETVWHNGTAGTGGGVSEIFPLPDYQAKANVPLSLNTNFAGRGVPDVAGDADPDTGYKVLVDGQQMVIGGTSAVAPLMAGFIALYNQKNGRSAGFINPVIYADPSLARDIVTGDNITTSTGLGYTAAIGWDACTGLGVLSKLPPANGTAPEGPANA
jgi:kumamolisin